MGANHKSTLSALAAVVLWASLAPLTALTPEIPTFLKTGLGLIIGATCAIPVWTREAGLARLRIRDVLLGIYGLLGYHTFLFLAFDTSPKVSANLINYLWPLFIVVLAPVFNRQLVLGPRLSLAALLGFVGAGLAILSAGSAEITFYPGYFFALAAALVWSTFSLASARSATFSARSLGLAALFSGAISICAHLLFEKSTTLDVPQILLLVAMGLGPLGAAFYFWDHALRQGNPQQVGLLSFLTPLLSTSILLVVTGQQLSILLVASALLIAGGSLLGGMFRGGMAVGPVIGAAFIALYGVESGYLAVSLMCLVAGAAVFSVPVHRLKTTPSGQQGNVWQVAKRESKKLLTLGVASAIISSGRTIRLVGLPLLAVSLSIDPATSSFIFGVTGFIDFALFYLSGIVMDKFGKFWSSVPTLLALGFTYLFAFMVTDLTSFWILAAVTSLANALSAGINMILGADLAPSGSRNEFLASFRMLTSGGVAVAPAMIAGLTAAIGLAPALAATGLLNFVGAYLFWRYLPIYAPDKK